MSWSNVLLIFRREVRDQLRDRRTLFTVLVLPLLLYPLLGATFLQIAQFMREHAVRVLILGAEHLPQNPPLLLDDNFAPEVLGETKASLFKVTLASPGTDSADEVSGQAKDD